MRLSSAVPSLPGMKLRPAPLLALALVYVAFAYFAPRQPASVLRIALPVLMSLAVIRLLARVLTVAFPNSGFARVMERVFSWLAWIAAVLK